MLKQFLQRFSKSPIAKGFITTVVGTGSAKVIIFVATFIVTHILSQKDFGQFSFVRSTLEMILSICAVNFSGLVTKFSSEAIIDNRALHKLLILFIFSLLICILVGTVIICLPTQVLLRFFINDNIVGFFKYISICLPIFFLSPMVQGIYRSQLRFKMIGWLLNISAVIYFTTTISGAAFNGLDGALFGIFIFYLIKSIIDFIPLFRRLSIATLITRSKGFIHEKSVINKMILPTFVNSFIEVPAFWIAQVLLINSGGFIMVASMTIVMQIRNIIMIIPGYFFATFIAFASKMNAEKDYVNYFKKSDYIIKNILYISIVGVIVLIISGKLLLSLFGSEYITAYLAFVIASLYLPAFLLISLFRNNMVLLEHQRTLLLASIFWNVIWIGLFYLFIKLSVFTPLLSFFVSQDIAIVIYLSILAKTYYSDKSRLLNEIDS